MFDLLGATARTVLDSLYKDDARQRAAGLPVPQRTRNLDRGSGEFLALTVIATHAQTIVEVGSSNAVSTIWLAAGGRVSGGRVTGSEILVERAAQANANLAAAELADIARVLPGDARQTLAEALPAGRTIDLLFIDAEKDDYAEHLLTLVDRVRPGGLILADNVLSHDISAYQTLVRKRADLLTMTLPLKRGMEYTVRMN